LIAARHAEQPQCPPAQQAVSQPQLPVQTPVWQQPQSQSAQQQSSQPAGHAPPQHAGVFATEKPETKADKSINVRKYMAILQETGLVKRKRIECGPVRGD
jgi:hypothetical protein